ncbi:hypothetical protein AVEN_57465-1 [Araneus ventricosus]|uniref:Uncharacterized protein n=1 Tax=Araneus ventricosus TaxID=182803 RepID=A0A4Y2CX16_ARAVE|nr:hypothetical protein AVEN_57465-1 [Araneus ventricosus]
MQRFKASNQKPSGLLQTPVSSQRFETLAIDLFGPLPESKDANPVERKNRELKPRLAILVYGKQTSWSERLPSIRFALNAAKCQTTGQTAAFLHFGRELRTVDDVTHGLRAVIENDDFVAEITPYLKKFPQFMAQAKEVVEQ